AVGTALVAELLSWLCVGYFRTHPHGMDAPTIKALFGTESMPPLPLFLLSSGGAAVAVIALSVRAAEAWRSAPWAGPLVALGQMAPALYFFHIVFGFGAVGAPGPAASPPPALALG